MNNSTDPTQNNGGSEHADLVSQSLDGTPNAEQFARLQQRLIADPDARRRFIDHLLLDAELAEEFSLESIGGMVDLLSPGSPGEKAASSLVPGVRLRPSLFRSPTVGYGAALASCIAVVIGATLWFSNPREPAPMRQDNSLFATITQTRNAWSANSEQPIELGQKLSAERVAIAVGSIEITLRNGVTMVLEGPCELELQTEMRAFLHAGEVVVRVPKGMSGFQLDTASASILDLGTEFAAKAGERLDTDVQVYDGAVLATPHGARIGGQFPSRIEAGQAVRFTPQTQGEPESIAYSDERFVRRLSTEKGIERGVSRREDERQFRMGQHDALQVTLAAAPITVDGRLDDWNAEGKFRSELSIARGNSIASPEFLEGRMMYDDKSVYIAAHIGDPFPMRNQIDPAMDREFVWRGGALQVRLSTDRSLDWPIEANGPSYYRNRGLTAGDEDQARALNPRLAHLTMWYHAPTDKALLHIAYGMNFREVQLNPNGFRGTFRRDDDGRGYVLEYAIPWTLLNAGDNPPRRGDNLAVSWTVHWSDHSGRRWRDQLVDIRNPEEPRRIFAWERAATWGRAQY